MEPWRSRSRLCRRGHGAERRRVVGGPEMLDDLALPVLVPGPGTANLAISNSAMLPSGRIPVGDPQGRDVSVVDLMQLGVLALLLGPDFNDMSRRH